MISRHLPLTSLRLPATELLPIAGVVVGPSRHQDITATSVATMLRSRGYPAEVYSQVRKSEVPFQAT
jgi:hypothetical protein